MWFDRKAVTIDVPENKNSIDVMCHKASELIHREVANGIPMNRIMVGGFSMGGCLALHLAYRFNRGLAGCLAMSSFLNHNSLVYEVIDLAYFSMHSLHSDNKISIHCILNVCFSH